MVGCMLSSKRTRLFGRKTISTSMHTHTYILKGNACISSVRCTIWTDERTNEWNGREREREYKQQASKRMAIIILLDAS
jgi:hypothetical protein